MSIESLLRSALPAQDPETTGNAIKDFLKDAILEALQENRSSPTADNDEDSEEIAMLRGEIGRLSELLNAHTEGVAGATQGGMDVLGERARQRRMEGYDDAHDDAHDDFTLSSAAIAYTMDARLRGTTGHGFTDTPPPDWPWDYSDWKQKSVRQALVVAAALIIAEIERLDRASISD